MDAAALLLLVSGVGVAFGWQPMPDGSQQYEYIVQLEPELAQTLADGRSIPIVSDVPKEVQPIGRIRVVVGREEPRRQRLVTRLKPATRGTGQDSAIELAQYNRYGDDRYATAPAQQAPATAPPGDRVAAAANPYATPQSQAGQEKTGESAWNSAQEEPPITPTGSAPPSSQELFGRASSGGGNSWNADSAIDSAANAAAQAASQLGSQLQQNAQPILQKGVQQIDSQVQAAADKFGNRTRDLVNELRQPFQQPQASANTPPQGAGSTAGSPNGHSWNQEGDPNFTQNPLRGDQEAGAAWNNDQPQANPPDPRSTASTPGGSGQASPTGESASIRWNTSPSGQAVNDRGSTPPEQPGADPWAGVPDPRSQAGAGGTAGAGGAVPGVATRPLPFGGMGTIGTPTGPQFPNMGNTTPQSPTAGQTASTQPAAGATRSQGMPEVRSHMLQQPGDRPLDGVTTPVAAAPTPTATGHGATPPVTKWGTGDQGPSTPTRATANAPATTTAATASPSAGSDNKVAILFAWVLLSGSVAGNFYLFWSYLDVRQKYRSLVRKTARAVGSVFSAA